MVGLIALLDYMPYDIGPEHFPNQLKLIFWKCVDQLNVSKRLSASDVGNKKDWRKASTCANGKIILNPTCQLKIAGPKTSLSVM